MKIFLSIALIVFITLSCTNKQSVKDISSETATLLSLEHKWLEAEFSLDTTYLSSIIDSSFISISDEGVKHKSEDLLSMYTNIKQRQQDSIFIDSFKLENTVVNIHDNTAIVTFIVHSFGKNKTEPRERWTRFYDVWIKRDNKWKAVSSQGTPVQSNLHV